MVAAVGEEAAEFAATQHGIGDLGSLGAGMVVGHLVRVVLDVGVADRDLQQVAEGFRS